MYLIYDTETCGLPLDYKAPITDHDNWPRMVSLSWQLHTEDGTLTKRVHRIIKPVGFTIPEEATKIHRISTEQALAEGKDLAEVLDEFSADVAQSRVMVAHNMAFDSCILGAEYDRLGLESTFFSLQMECTMEIGVPIAKIPGRYGYKWPRLEHLYFHLFRESLEGAHNSVVDTAACARCFFEMKK